MWCLYLPEALADRVLDYDENVRKKVVAAVYDVTCHSLTAIPPEIACLVAERLRDKSVTAPSHDVWSFLLIIVT